MATVRRVNSSSADGSRLSLAEAGKSYEALLSTKPELPKGLRAFLNSRSWTALFTFVTFGAFLGFAIHAAGGSSEGTAAGSKAAPGGSSGALSASASGPAALEFVSYTSSPMEKLFIEKLPNLIFPDAEETADNVTVSPLMDTHLPQYCSFVAEWTTQIRTWLTKVEESKAKGDMYFDDQDSKQVFSVFEFRYRCNEPAGFCTYKTMIEPLAFSLRHPAALCYHSYPDRFWKGVYGPSGIFDHDYLFLATKQQAFFGDQEFAAFDLGAMHSGETTPYAVIREYEKRGIDFHRMVLWDSDQFSGQSIYQSVPERWHHAFQMITNPVKNETTHPSYPLQIMKKVHPGNGLVAFKLDMHEHEVENTLVDTLIEWCDEIPAIKAGQFELFYDQRVNYKPMRRWWGKSAIEYDLKLADTYALFLKMRNIGIRAHSWI